METKHAAGAVVLVVVAVTAGCLGAVVEPTGEGIGVDVEPVDTDETGNEILASSVDAADGAETYSVEADSSLIVSGSFIFGASIPVEAEGGFDRGTGVGRVDAEGDVVLGAFGLSNQTRFETTVYTQNGTTYTRKSDGGADAEHRVSEGGVEDMSLSLNDTVSVYEDAEAEVLGVSNVNGTETYVLSLNVSQDDVGEHIDRLVDTYAPENFGEDGDEAVEDDIPDEEIEEFETYLWVDRETREPLRFGYYLRMGFESEGEGLLSIDVDGTGEFRSVVEYGYEDVNIERPEGIDGG